jgi:hypothetical protein
MTSPEREKLERLVKIGQLKREPPEKTEIDGLRSSGEARLSDAENATLALESRFDLVYNAAHALSLAALRRLGYRPANRYIVFQALEHTIGIPPATWRTLAKGHDVRNEGEYGGAFDVDERLVRDMIDAAKRVRAALRNAEKPPKA